MRIACDFSFVSENGELAIVLYIWIFNPTIFHSIWIVNFWFNNDRMNFDDDEWHTVKQWMRNQIETIVIEMKSNTMIITIKYDKEMVENRSVWVLSCFYNE